MKPPGGFIHYIAYGDQATPSITISALTMLVVTEQVICESLSR